MSGSFSGPNPNASCRRRYARPEEEQIEDISRIVQAPAADQVLPKAIAGAGLLTQIIIAKQVDHLPLYLQRAWVVGFGLTAIAELRMDDVLDICPEPPQLLV